MFRRTKFYIALLIFMAFSLPGKVCSGETKAFCPVAAIQEAKGGKTTCYLLGGWATEGWLQDKAAARLFRGGETYRLYNLSGELGESPGSPPAPFAPKGDPCHETLTVSLVNAPASKTGLVAVGSQVNALPRVPRLLGTDQKIYKEAAAEILRQKGINNPNVHVTQVISVDLDGDGSEEVLVSATHYAQKLRARACAGDYSVIFLRRLVHGKVVTSIIAGDFFPKGVKFGHRRNIG